MESFRSHPISATGVLPTTHQLRHIDADAKSKIAPPSPILTKQALADLLTCSTRQIEKLVSSGKLPRPFLIGNSPRWHKEWIEHFFSQLKPGDQLVGKKG
jgi:hypothetical protein